jgi:hypothetical protein
MSSQIHPRLEWYGIDLSGSRWRPVTGFCEHNNEMSGPCKMLGSSSLAEQVAACQETLNLTALIQILCFWTLSIVLFLFNTQSFGNWILSSKRRVLNKNRMMDNVQKHNICTIIINFRSYP